MANKKKLVIVVSYKVILFTFYGKQIVVRRCQNQSIADVPLDVFIKTHLI